eukprot:11374135-Alexandrium_andersonii.AAC.1
MSNPSGVRAFALIERLKASNSHSGIAKKSRACSSASWRGKRGSRSRAYGYDNSPSNVRKAVR